MKNIKREHEFDEEVDPNMDHLPWSTRAIDYVEHWEEEAKAESFVYTDGGDEYEQPQRIYENQVLNIRLYCNHEGCNKYIKGSEGYNGSFLAEDGSRVDLRNQCFICREHQVFRTITRGRP